MKRLYHLSRDQIKEWFMERDQFGTEKYGDMHLKRYGLVDVVEELSDAHHILRLYKDRCKKKNITIGYSPEYKKALSLIEQAVDALQDLDRITPEIVCTDENGGERIWWNEDHSARTQKTI